MARIRSIAIEAATNRTQKIIEVASSQRVDFSPMYGACHGKIYAHTFGSVFIRYAANAPDESVLIVSPSFSEILSLLKISTNNTDIAIIVGEQYETNVFPLILNTLPKTLKSMGNIFESHVMRTSENYWFSLPGIVNIPDSTSSCKPL